MLILAWHRVPHTRRVRRKKDIPPSWRMRELKLRVTRARRARITDNTEMSTQSLLGEV